MPSGIALVIWIAGTIAGVCFVSCCVIRGFFLKYFFLNLYVILSLFADLSRQYVLHFYGQESGQYFYAYFYTDCLLTVALFVAVISLASRVFAELQLAKYVRFVAVLLLLGTAGFSYAVVAQSSERLATTFAFELSQNLYFVGIVLTYLLWGAVLKLRETRTRLVQIVLSLGLYFSAYAASYALYNVAPQYGLVRYAGGAIGCLLPLAWCITIMRYSEEARLAPAQLLAVPR